MAISSNLYETKVLSEHPLAIWSLDESADYVSLITESQRNFASWSISNGTVGVVPETLRKLPFSNSICNAILTKTSSSVSITSPGIINRSELFTSVPTFTVGAYVYVDGSVSGSTKASIGFKYGVLKQEKTFTVSSAKTWQFISATFEVPDRTVYANDNFILTINFTGLNNFNQNIFVNGVSFGQECEEFISSSLGFVKEVLFTNMPSISSIYGAKATASGLAVDSNRLAGTGYYLINDKMLTKNSNIPIVYGSRSTTSILPNGNEPSLIFPGLGFLHNNGKDRTLSVEFWLRANSDVSSPHKIFGPIASNDGLYVDGPFIIWKIGKYYGSHYVGEWYRPMLINISYSSISSSVMVNGKQVIFLNFDYDETTQSNGLSFPVNVYIEAVFGEPLLTDLETDTDWLGFYGHENIPQLDVDCFAIYSYEIPSAIAKRRWVYGQAVEFPENTITESGGITVQADFTFSEYSNNHSIPLVDGWESDILESISITNNTLSSANYVLPQLYFDTKTEAEWYTATSDEGLTSICLKPNSSWTDVNGYILFNRLSFINDNISAIYGVFEAPFIFDSEEVLFKLLDQRTNSYLLAYLSNETDPTIKYNFFNRIKDTTTLISTSSAVKRGMNFSTGINLTELSQQSQDLKEFLDNSQRLTLLVGGDETYSKTFSGKIHNVSFCSSKNYSKLQETVASGIIMPDTAEYDGGIPNQSAADPDWQYSVNGGSPDSVYVYNGDEQLNLAFDDAITLYDGGIVGSSQDPTVDSGTPGTTSWTQTYDANGVTIYVPSGVYNNNLLDRYGTYSLFVEKYIDTFDLSIGSASYWEKTVPLKTLAKVINPSTGEYNIDYIQYNIDYPKPASTDDIYWNSPKSMVKSYISFQASNATRELDFNTAYRMKSNNFIDASSSWQDSIFEVVDGSVIYPPTSNIDNILVTNHIEIKTSNTIKRSVKIKSLQLSAKSLIANEKNPIGTRFSQKVYPYESDNVSNVFQSSRQNPVLLYKKSTPYLYLTRNSGFTPLTNWGDNNPKGLAIPINEQKADDFYLSSVLMSLRYDYKNFPAYINKFATVKYNNDYIDLYLESTNSDPTKAIISARRRSDNNDMNIFYYLNGRYVQSPIITSGSWNNICLVFTNQLDMTDVSKDYYLAFVGPVTFNNVVLSKQGITTIPDDVLNLSEYYGFTVNQINNEVTGTKTTEIGDSYGQLSTSNYQYSYYKNIASTIKSLTPA